MGQAWGAAAPAVGIVVVNWNGADRSRRCLRSLLALDYPCYRICLVDNGSSDGGAGVLRAEFPDVEILVLPTNRGYAGGGNAGLAWARGTGVRYVWLLNNDVTADRDALRALVDSAEKLGRPALLAPKILSSEEPGRVWSAGGRLRWPWLKGEHIGLGDEEERHQVPRQVAWASGCALFFPLAVADILGPMDERYFLYLEDIDWCLRARRQALPIWYVPEAKLWHDVSRSVDRLDPRIVRYYAYRNQYLLAFQHGGRLGRAWFALHLAVTFLKIGVRTLLFRSYRRDRYYQARTRALIDFVLRRFGKAPFSDEPRVRLEPAIGKRSVT